MNSIAVTVRAATAWHWFLSAIQSIITASWSWRTTSTPTECRAHLFWNQTIQFQRSIFSLARPWVREWNSQMAFRWNRLNGNTKYKTNFQIKWKKKLTKNQVKRSKLLCRTPKHRIRSATAASICIVFSFLRARAHDHYTVGFECTVHYGIRSKESESRKTLIKTSKWIRWMIILCDAFGPSRAYQRIVLGRSRFVPFFFFIRCSSYTIFFAVMWLSWFVPVSFSNFQPLVKNARHLILGSY